MLKGVVRVGPGEDHAIETPAYASLFATSSDAAPATSISDSASDGARRSPASGAMPVAAPPETSPAAQPAAKMMDAEATDEDLQTAGAPAQPPELTRSAAGQSAAPPQDPELFGNFLMVDKSQDRLIETPNYASLFSGPSTAAEGAVTSAPCPSPALPRQPHKPHPLISLSAMAMSHLWTMQPPSRGMSTSCRRHAFTHTAESQQAMRHAGHLCGGWFQLSTLPQWILVPPHYDVTCSRAAAVVCACSSQWPAAHRTAAAAGATSGGAPDPVAEQPPDAAAASPTPARPDLDAEPREARWETAVQGAGEPELTSSEGSGEAEIGEGVGAGSKLVAAGAIA